MSPIEPFSPTSPMSISPISPAEARMILSMPGTPVLAPVMCLPRLITAFQGAASDTGNIASLSDLYKPNTPSPLSLGRTSATVAGILSTAPWRRKSVLMDEGMYKVTSPVSPISPSRQRRARRDTNSYVTPVLTRKPPSLFRQNANEGLERLFSVDASSTSEQRAHLPLRINTTNPVISGRSSLQGPAATRDHLPKTKARHHSDRTSVPSSRPRSRSPIHKSKTRSTRPHRHLPSHQKSSSTFAPQPPLFIHNPQSPATARRTHELKARLHHLARPLVPLVSVTTGKPHPDFPLSLLHFQLLTHEQLNGLARWYHQTGDAGRARWMYPCPIDEGKIWCGVDGGTETGTGGEDDVVVDLATKRRRWGRFIGLQGCESPVLDGDGGVEEGEREGDGESVEDLEGRMAREWREGLRRAREQEEVREKMWRGRF